MTRRILVAIDDRDYSDMIVDIINAWSKSVPAEDAPQLDFARCCQQGCSKLQKFSKSQPLDLIIARDELPESPDASSQEGDCGGIRLIQEAHQSGRCLHSIILAPKLEPSKHGVLYEIPGCIPMLRLDRLKEALMRELDVVFSREQPHTTSREEAR